MLSNSAKKLVLSWCQGVGGHSEFGTACPCVGDSPYMWLTMLTRRGSYYLPLIWGEPRRRPSSLAATTTKDQPLSSLCYKRETVTHSTIARCRKPFPHHSEEWQVVQLPAWSPIPWMA